MSETTSEDVPDLAGKPSKPFYRDLTFKVVTGMVLGVAVGAFAPDVGHHLDFLGDIFINLIQMVVGLIIFCTVTHGIASVRDLGRVGRIAVKALILSFATMNDRWIRIKLFLDNSSSMALSWNLVRMFFSRVVMRTYSRRLSM